MIAYFITCIWSVLISKLMDILHTCEPSDGRINSPVFLVYLRISNYPPNYPNWDPPNYPPVFSWLLHIPPVFSCLYMFTSQMCKLHHVHLGQGSNMQLDDIPVIYWILYTVQESFILTSKFVLTTLYTHPGLIISHLVDDYLNICLLKQ